MRNRRAGSRFGGGIKDVWVGKGVGTGRAALKLKQGEIPACFFRFKPDEPENEANPARSVFMRLKHARDKPVGSAGGRRIYPAHVSTARRRSSRVDTMFRLVKSAICISARGSAQIPASSPRDRRRLLFPQKITRSAGRTPPRRRLSRPYPLSQIFLSAITLLCPPKPREEERARVGSVFLALLGV